MSEEGKVDESKVLTFEVFEAKPNAMFTEDQRKWVRFLRYTDLVACAECGKRKRRHWTVLYSFQAYSMGYLVPVKSGKVHLPFTPVCCDHLLAVSEYTPPPKRKKKKAKEEDKT